MDDRNNAACDTRAAYDKAEQHRFAGNLNGAIGGCAREMTVGEMLDRRLDAAHRVVHQLNDLKASLPGSVLNSAASRFSALGA